MDYEILQRHKHNQQQLIAVGIIEKSKIQWGFTSEERAEFDKGRSVEEVFDNIANKYGFEKSYYQQNIGIIEFSMEENQSEILIKNIYFKNR